MIKAKLYITTNIREIVLKQDIKNTNDIECLLGVAKDILKNDLDQSKNRRIIRNEKRRN